MRERPILFSAPMVRALLDGSKTQTRRADKRRSLEWIRNNEIGLCPYGVPGDRLWVRETWAAPHGCDHLKPSEIDMDWRFHYAATEERGGLRWRPSIHMPRWASRIDLEITGVGVEPLQDISNADALAEGVEAWRAGWDVKTAATMFLQGTKACIETNDGPVAKRLYMLLWEQINGASSWAANPWVWSVEFKRIKP